MPHSYLSLNGENIVLLLEDREKFRIPLVNIENIVCFGYMGCSPALMGKCVENKIGLSFLKPNGAFLARLSGPLKGSVFLRKKQYQLSDDVDFCLHFSQNLMAAKFHNSRHLLERSLRDHQEIPGREKLAELSQQFKLQTPKIYTMLDKESLRGLEGAQAKLYFGVFDHLIIQQKKQFAFFGRNKRPPLDKINCMLSYLYTLLSLEITSALETVGLDPYVGFMHELRSGRASLAVDLEEELRAYLVDRLVLSLVNLKIVNQKDFITKEGGAVLFTDDGRKKILTAWQEKKKEVIVHPIIDEKIELGLLPYVQAQLLARYLRGDLPEYPNFLAK